MSGLPTPARRWSVPLTPGHSVVVHEHRGVVGDRLAAQFHREYELTWVERGPGRRMVGDTIDHFDDGDLVLLGPCLPHAWSVESPDETPPRFAVLMFSTESLGPELLAKEEFAPIRRLLKRAERGLQFPCACHALVGETLSDLSRQSPSRQLLQALSLLDSLAASRSDPITASDYRPNADEEALLNLTRVLLFIQGESQRPISLAEVAEIAGMPVPTFTRFFRRETGQSFVTYLNRYRVEHACQLLHHTDQPIIDIALQVGFNNLSHFNRQFLRFIQTTPSTYRRQGSELGIGDPKVSDLAMMQ